ncbi:MAG TPA: response regulator [Nitrososphaeraceae archaeon]|nr:response regulator [Nitrososphaeraceae archaeon]
MNYSLFNRHVADNKLWGSFLILINNPNHNNNNNHTILLVDDENDILNLFSDYLQKFGYETIPFNNPVDALNHLNTSNNSNCSLVISDYKMSQMTGIDLIKKIREKDSTFKLKIILISAFIKSDILNNDISNSLRIDKIIEKPVHLENLKDEIQKLLLTK